MMVVKNRYETHTRGALAPGGGAAQETRGPSAFPLAKAGAKSTLQQGEGGGEQAPPPKGRGTITPPHPFSHDAPLAPLPAPLVPPPPSVGPAATMAAASSGWTKPPPSAYLAKLSA